MSDKENKDQGTLLGLITEHCKKTNTSYVLSENEHELAKKLVKKGLLYYAKDYTMVRPLTGSDE